MGVGIIGRRGWGCRMGGETIGFLGTLWLNEDVTARQVLRCMGNAALS